MTDRHHNPWKAELQAAGLVAVVVALGMGVLLGVLWNEPQRVLAFNDGNIELVLSPLFSYPGSLSRIWNDQFFFGRGEPGIGISVWSLLETILGPYQYRRLSPIIAGLLVGLAGFWTCRQMGRSRSAALVAALFLAFCGWTATSPLSGLVGRSMTLFWSLLAIGILERNERLHGHQELNKKTYLLGCALAGGAVGLAVCETADIGAFFSLTIAAWWLFALRPLRQTLSAWRPYLLGLLTLIAISGLTASHTLDKMVATELSATLAQNSTTTQQQTAQQQTTQQSAQWDWATQWSLPVQETVSLVLPGFHGTSSRADDAPYWGQVGRTPGWRPMSPGWQNFKLNGYFIGMTATLLLLFLGAELFRRRLEEDLRRPALCALFLAVGALALAWGRFFIAYRVFFALPYMNAIRNPEKWLGPMSLFVGLAVAIAVDALVLKTQALRTQHRIQPNRTWGRSVDAVAFGFAALVLLAFNTFTPGNSDLALERHSLANNTTQNAVLTALIVLALLALAWRLLPRLPEKNLALGVAAVLAVVMSVELLAASRPYVATTDPSYLNEPSEIAQTLDSLEPQGRLKLLPARQTVLNNWRQSYLASRGRPLFDPISVRVMPVEEGRFFSAFAQRPMDFWALAGIRWFLCTPPLLAELQAASEEFVLHKTLLPADWDPRYADTQSSALTQEPISLVELKTAQPLLRMIREWEAVPDTPEANDELLQRFSNPGFAARDARFIHVPDGVELPTEVGVGDIQLIEETPVRLVVETQGAGVLLRASRYDPRWRVTIDGKPATLLRANVLFQAVAVPPGEHRVVFEFKPPQTLYNLSIVVRFALLGLAFFFFRAVRSDNAS